MLKQIKRWSRHRSPIITPFILGVVCAVGTQILWWVSPHTPAAPIWCLTWMSLTLLVLNRPYLSYRRTWLVTTCIVAGLVGATPPLWFLRWGVWTPTGWLSYAAVSVFAWLVLITLVAAVVAVRRALVKGHGLGRCRKCGYSRAGLASDTCPECGSVPMPDAPPHDAMNAVSRASSLLHDQYFSLPALHYDEPNRRLLIPFACTASRQRAKPDAAATGPQTPLFAARLRIEQVLSCESRGATNIEVYTLRRLEVSKDSLALTLYLVANEDLLIKIEVAALDLHIDLSDVAVGHKHVVRILGLIELDKHAETQINWPKVHQWTTEPATSLNPSP